MTKRWAIPALFVLTGCPWISDPIDDPVEDTDPTVVDPDTDPIDDFLPVTITGIAPAIDAVDVPLDTQVLAQFDFPVVFPDDATEPAFVVTAAGQPVAGTVAFNEPDSEGHLWGLIPSAPLEPDTVYDVVVSEQFELDPSLGPGGMVEPFSWSFTTGGPAELTVVQTQPADRAVDVPVDTVVTVELSRNVLPDSVNDTTVQLIDAGGSQVYGELIANETTIELAPYSLLRAGTTYTLNLTAGVLDDESQPLAQAVSVQFDTIGPLRPVSMSPSDGSTNVLSATPLVLTFNVDIDPSTVDNNSIMPRPNRSIENVFSSTVSGSVTVAGNTLTFVPIRGEWQEYETQYRIELDRGLRGVNGEPLEYLETWDFTSIFFDPNQTYLFHTFANGRDLSMAVTPDQFLRAQFTSDLGASAYSRWFIERNGEWWWFRNLWAGTVSRLDAGTDGNPNRMTNPPPGGGVYTGQQWRIQSYGGHPNFTQRWGESPSLYYIKNEWRGDNETMTVQFDSALGYRKVTMARPTGNIGQLFWFSRY